MTVKDQCFNATGRKRAFTLIELVIGLAIGSLILALMYNFLSTSLSLSSRTIQHLNRVDDIDYALNYISDEINGAKYFTRQDNALIFYTYDRDQSPHHRYHHYFVEDEKLYRGANHYPKEQENVTVKDITRGKNLILDNVEDFSYELSEDQLIWRVIIDSKEYEFNHWLRGK